jgi:hypothetical protein
MEIKHQPFYVGETVIAVNALPKSEIKNGTLYVVYSCECRINPANGLGPFWYVGVETDGYKSHAGITPRLFASIERPSLMVFEKINESTPIHVN